MNIILPEINFLETNAEKLSRELISFYEELEKRKLAQADPLHLIFLTIASVITKQNVAINDAAKQNLLYYARDDVLDYKGAEWSTERLPATAAKVTVRIHFSVPITEARIIEKGTQATSSEGAIFFETKEPSVIEIGSLFLDLDMECTSLGTIGNNFTPGQIDTLVVPLPYVSKVENITTSHGGAEREDDTAYKARIYLAPEALTNAGSEGAYKYFAQSASALISDVYVYMPTPGRVNISVLLQNGELPTQEILDLVYEKCSAKTVRPLTDQLTVNAPNVIPYDLNVVYYIETNAVDKTVIQENILKAIDDYVVWQQLKIGRDINASKLISMCIAAGAKRVDVISPTFTLVNEGEVAQINTKTVTFGGVEDD